MLSYVIKFKLKEQCLRVDHIQFLEQFLSTVPYFKTLRVERILWPINQIGSLPINKILLKKVTKNPSFVFIFSMAAFVLQQQSRIVATEIVCPRTSKNYIALFTKCLLISDLRHWPRHFTCVCLRGLGYINSKVPAISCSLILCSLVQLCLAS